MIMNLIGFYYTLVLIPGLLISLFISLTDYVYDMEQVLISKKHFIRCVFMYQVAVWKRLSEEINSVGMIILEVLTTLSIWVLNIFIFLILLALLIFKIICLLFYAVFKKK